MEKLSTITCLRFCCVNKYCIRTEDEIFKICDMLGRVYTRRKKKVVREEKDEEEDLDAELAESVTH